MAPDGGKYAGPDGIDENVWSRLLTITCAAHAADASAYAGDVLQWQYDFPLPGQHLLGVYLVYLLSYRVKEYLRQNRPTDDDLRDVAVAAYPAVLRVLDRIRLSQVEEIIRIAFDRPPADPSVDAGEFVACGGAVLGVLLDEPDRQLAEMRPRLAAWWTRNRDHFRAEGLRDYDNPSSRA